MSRQTDREKCERTEEGGFWIILNSSSAAVEQQAAELLAINEDLAQYGLHFSRQEAQQIVAARSHTLQQHRRVEFGPSVTGAIIRAFCDSEYVQQENFTETVMALQDIFFNFKNETQDCMTDEELLHFMREQFDGVCGGDLAYLSGTVLPVYAQAVRGGYRGFEASDGYQEYSQFDETPRWDPELYQEVLRELLQ